MKTHTSYYDNLCAMPKISFDTHLVNSQSMIASMILGWALRIRKLDARLVREREELWENGLNLISGSPWGNDIRRFLHLRLPCEVRPQVV